MGQLRGHRPSAKPFALAAAPLLVALGLLLGGCQALPRQAAVSHMDALHAEIAALQTALVSTQNSLQLLNDKQDHQSDSVVSELKSLDAKVTALPRRVGQVCQQAEQAPAEQCSEERLVIKNDDRMVVGELEHVWLEPPGISLTARIDTGAESSSVNAQNLVEFERDGDEWVRFEWLIDGKTTTIERPIKRYVRVVQQADPDGTRRPVVSLRLRIGDTEDDFDFSLADRSHLDHQMNLGRNFLTDVAVVDVGRRFVQPPITGKSRPATARAGSATPAASGTE